MITIKLNYDKLHTNEFKINPRARLLKLSFLQNKMIDDFNAKLQSKPLFKPKIGLATKNTYKQIFINYFWY